MTLTSAQGKARIGAQWCAIALGFAVTVSTALDSVLLAVFIVLWSFSGDLAGRLRFMRGHPVASMALLFAALMLLGMAWSAASAVELRETVVIALRFIVIGLFAVVFLDSSTRDRAQFAFLLSSTLILVLSFSLWSGIVDSIPGLTGRPDYPGVFKYHNTHNVLMAVAALLFALHALEARNRRARVLLWVLAGAAIFNVFILIPGCSGQLGLAAAILYLAFTQRRWRGAAVVGAALIVLGSAAWLAPRSVLQPGVSKAPQELNASRPEQTVPEISAVGVRLALYRNALELIGEHPVIGAGSGAFRSAYEAKVRGTQMVVTDHPYNAFLHTGVELGLIGLAVLVLLFVVQWRSTSTLNNFTERVAARGFVLIFVVAGLTSLSFGDHVEGLFYAWASGLFFANAHWPSKARDTHAAHRGDNG